MLNKIALVVELLDAAKELDYMGKFAESDKILHTVGTLVDEIGSLENQEALPEDESEGDEADWKKEQAREEGMIHGVDAYNDMMGQSTEVPYKESDDSYRAFGPDYKYDEG